MFAFGIVDFHRRHLVLARDHLGIKPLYYRRNKGYLAFGSELSSVCAVHDIRPKGSLRALDLYLRFQYIPTPHTIYQDIYKLPPASYVLVDFDGTVSGPNEYWRVDFSPEEGVADDEWELRAAEATCESVKAHLVSDVPFGVLISGGADSTLVALQMSRVMQGPIKAFTIAFEEQEYSELVYAEKVAKQCGLELHSEMLGDDALDILPELVMHYGEPFGDSSVIPTWYVSRLARQHVPMVLSGDGGDEAFGGYDNYLQWVGERSVSAVSYVGKVKSWVQHLINREPISRLAQWQRYILYFGHASRVALWRGDYKQLVDLRCELFEQASEKATNYDDLTYAQFLDYQTYLPCDILTKVDVASMYHGLEVRTPLVDLRIVEFASRLPRGQRLRRINGGDYVSKYVLKRLLGRHFDKDFVHRKKKGFAVPRAIWFQEGQKAQRLLKELIVGQRLRLRQWFNVNYMESLLSSHNAQCDNSGALWLFLVMAIWLDQNQDVSFN
jgi:asparagine synthase (glutamine-hydrolysing)